MLTRGYFYAKIQIVKEIFTLFGKSFHKLQKILKNCLKSENNFQNKEKSAKNRKEAKSEQDFVTGTAHV